MKKHGRLVATLLSLAVAGCGGGGGGSSPAPAAGAPGPWSAPSPSPSPAPGPAGLSVTSTTPVNGSTGVARSSAVSFTLNAVPSANSLPTSQSSSVQLLTPEGVNLLTGVTIQADTVSIANSGLALAGNTSYKVTLASSVADTSGKTLGSPFSWTFTTAPEDWVLPGTSISPDVQDFGPLGLATDPAGNVFCTWNDNENTIRAQLLNAANNSWASAATTVFHSTDGELGSLNITTVPGGEPVLTWVGQQDQYDLGIFLSTFQLTGSGTGTWSTPVVTPIVPVSGILGNSDPLIPHEISVVSFANTLTIAADIVNESVLAQGIYVTQYDQVHKTWGATQVINSTPSIGSLASTHVAADAAGNLTVAWISSGHVLASIKAAGSTSWSAPKQVDTLTAGGLSGLALAGGVNGTTATWEQIGTTVPFIEASRLSSDLTTWSVPVQLDDGSSPTGARNPSIAIDNAGFVDISYTQTNTSMTVAATDGIFLVRYSPTSTAWSSPIRMSAVGAGVSASAPAIAVDNAGNVQLLYLVAGGIAPANYLVSTSTVIDPGIIDNPNGAPSGLAYPPSLIIGPDNVATGAWPNNMSSGTYIRADRKL